MTGFLLALRLFKVYSVVSEWLQSDSLPLFVIPDSFFLFVHLCLPSQVRLAGVRQRVYFTSDLGQCKAFPALLPEEA